MNLYDLVDTLHGKGKFSDDRRAKLRSSAIAYATHVHDKTCVADLLPEDYLEPKIKRHERIDDKLFLMSFYKRRNVRQEIDQILRLSLEEGLIPDPETIVPKINAQPIYTWGNPPFPGPLPKRDSENQHRVAKPYGLRYADFPDLLSQEVDAWIAWVRPSTTATRPLSCELRETSIKSHLARIEGYFGYLIKYGGWTRDELTFEHLIDIGSLKAFVQWHSFDRVPGIQSSTISSTAYSILGAAHSLANTYFNNEKAKIAIRAYQKQKGKPAAVKNKNLIVSGITIKMLYDAAFNEFPSQPSTNPGQSEYVAATRGLVMALFNVGPLRNQNYREAILGRNIYCDTAPTASAPGLWKLFFTGAPGPARLKRHRNQDGSVNEYHSEVPAEVCRMLDVYVDKYRPLVNSNKKEKTFLLNTLGKPFSQTYLNQTVETGFYRWLGRLLNVHILRDIISTEIYETTRDAAYASEIINDHTATFLATYNRSRLKQSQALHHQNLTLSRAPIPKETPRTKSLTDDELINAVRARVLSRQQVFGY